MPRRRVRDRAGRARVSEVNRSPCDILVYSTYTHARSLRRCVGRPGGWVSVRVTRRGRPAGTGGDGSAVRAGEHSDGWIAPYLLPACAGAAAGRAHELMIGRREGRPGEKNLKKARPLGPVAYVPVPSVASRRPYVPLASRVSSTSTYGCTALADFSFSDRTLRVELSPARTAEVSPGAVRRASVGGSCARLLADGAPARFCSCLSGHRATRRPTRMARLCPRYGRRPSPTSLPSRARHHARTVDGRLDGCCSSAPPRAP